MATVQAHRVLQVDLALGGALVTGIGQPAVGLEQDGGTEILLRVPPVRRARRRATGAENALVQAVELLSVLLALAILLALCDVSAFP